MIAKHKTTGRLYEIAGLAHSRSGNPADDVYRCRILSAYDGMPIGPAEWLPVTVLDFGTKSPNTLPHYQFFSTAQPPR